MVDNIGKKKNVRDQIMLGRPRQDWQRRSKTKAGCIPIAVAKKAKHERELTVRRRSIRIRCCLRKKNKSSSGHDKRGSRG